MSLTRRVAEHGDAGDRVINVSRGTSIGAVQAEKGKKQLK